MVSNTRSVGGRTENAEHKLLTRKRGYERETERERERERERGGREGGRGERGEGGRERPKTASKIIPEGSFNLVSVVDTVKKRKKMNMRKLRQDP